MSQALGSRAIRALILVALIEVGAVGFKFGVQIVIARLAGAHQYGVYTYALTWANTLAIPAGLGMSAIVIRYVPAYMARANWDRLSSLLSFTRLTTLAASVATSAIAVLSAIVISQGHPGTALLLGLLMLPLLAQSTLQAEILRGSGKLLTSRLIPNLMQPAAILLFTVTWFRAFDGIGAVGAMVSMACGLGVSMAVQSYAIGRSVSSRAKGHGKAPQRRQWTRLGLQLLSIKFSQLILNNSDILLVGIILGPLQAGIYGAAKKTAALVGVVTQAVNLMVPPEVARMSALGDVSGVQSLIRRSAKFAIIPSVLGAVVLSLGAANVMSVFGPEFRAGSMTLVVLALGRLVTSWTGPVGSLLNVTGHQRVSIRTYAVAAAVQFGLGLLLIPGAGIVGAAVASASAMTLWNLVLAARTMQLLQVRLWPLPERNLN